MAKQPQSKKNKAETEAAFAEMQKRLDAAVAARQEELRPKNYEDLMRYAREASSTGAVFPRNVSVSPFETAAPYYGESAPQELAAAAEYATRLKQSEQPVVTIDPAYYEQIKTPIRTVQSDIGSLYLPKQNLIGMMSPAANAERVLSLTPKELEMNNYLNTKDLAQGLEGSENLAKSFRDTLEHEAFHAIDENVKFSEKPKKEYVQAKKDLGLGYMANENHLVTGLGKVQREWYSKTGQRFESPNQFKQFVFDLANSENPEQEISSFSQEAKRTLRPQIQNAIQVQKYYNQLDSWKANKSWLKGNAPTAPIWNVDFLEKSARLIPALVEYRQAAQPTA